ncbi:MAG TPA: acetaldehyde dehydrogenase (acetylating) [Ideonella sp.]|uniref:acetaldehyde dehydrogenase (acetylating) n=1 Tax=Ideonella sp. TaxID=1929293 RepID=UPI002C350E8A|nr:acetaldehyde dehydrogenase (acetylating) [Ideonella sp.]HSI48419.1 acetaldehyde dehydrogenase (acetylating) [Ideonella sp.]
MIKKARVAILGTGNIGTDLLIKAMRSEALECTLFVGRNFRSDGMQKASNLGVNISDRGLDGIVAQADDIDIVFDATSAAAHLEHWPVLQRLGKTVIDMTPAKVGDLCVPAINSEQIVASGARNINMITCGGQASVPIANAIAAVQDDIDYIEVASSISSRSAGPATRANLDEYIETTEQALLKFSGAKQAKAILILNPARPPIDMQTTIYAKIRNPDLKTIRASVDEMMARIVAYVPGYQLIVPPTIEGGKVMTTVKVLGNGDYLPRYAGNLDIINCAAIGIAETIARQGGR